MDSTLDYAPELLDKTLFDRLERLGDPGYRGSRIALLLTDGEEHASVPEILAGDPDVSCHLIDCTAVEPGCLTEHLLESLDIDTEDDLDPVPAVFPRFHSSERGFHVPGKRPFVSKAMAWLRLSDALIAVDRYAAPQRIVLYGLECCEEETRREALRLIRLYLTHKPHCPLLVVLPVEAESLLPAEYLSRIPLRLTGLRANP